MDKIELKVEIPKEVELEIVNDIIKTKGPKGETEKSIYSPKIKIEKKDNQIILISSKTTKHEKELINTFRAHIRNLINGVVESYMYKLKICSSHFPMSVSILDNELIIKNFVGEKIPRKAKLLPNTNVKIEGDVITVESCNKELAGQTAANIEKACKRPGFDKRVFQDGIYLFLKAGKEIK